MGVKIRKFKLEWVENIIIQAIALGLLCYNYTLEKFVNSRYNLKFSILLLRIQEVS